MASKNRKARKAAAKAKKLARLAAIVGLTKDDDELDEWDTANMVDNKTATTTPAAGTTYYRSVCDHDLVPLFRLGRAAIYGGMWSDIKYSHVPFKLMVSCAGSCNTPEPLINISPGARALVKPELHAVAETPYIALSWPDGGTPGLTLKQWGAIAESLAGIDGPVAVYCVGGHGRTGTTLAILASLGGLVPPEQDPVEWVRERYCELAVETESQCRYIERIIGRKITARGSDATTRWYNPVDGAAVRTYTQPGGYQVTATGVSPLPNTPTPPTALCANCDTQTYCGNFGCLSAKREHTVNGTAQPAAQGKLPIPPPSPAGSYGCAIVNKAGDIIGWDYTRTDGRTEITKEELDAELDREALDAEARDRSDTKGPWHQWGK